jgi:hypothetical protein
MSTDGQLNERDLELLLLKLELLGTSPVTRRLVEYVLQRPASEPVSVAWLRVLLREAPVDRQCPWPVEYTF